MASEWYFMKSGKPDGPHSLSKLKQAIASGKLPPSIPVWNADMPAWQGANTLAEFAPPPPKPAPAPKPVRVVPELAVAANGQGSSDSPSHVTEPTPPRHFHVSPSTPLESDKKPSRPARAYLNSIRRTTCYSALRLVINVCFGIAMIVAVLAICLSLIAIFASTDSRPHKSPSLWPLLVSILAPVLIVAWRDGSVLLIDMADTLLHHHSTIANVQDE